MLYKLVKSIVCTSAASLSRRYYSVKRFRQCRILKCSWKLSWVMLLKVGSSNIVTQVWAATGAWRLSSAPRWWPRAPARTPRRLRSSRARTPSCRTSACRSSLSRTCHPVEGEICILSPTVQKNPYFSSFFGISYVSSPRFPAETDNLFRNKKYAYVWIQDISYPYSKFI